LDTVKPRVELNTSSSETPGVQTGGTEDTSISRLSKIALASAVCNKLTTTGQPPLQPNPDSHDFVTSETKNRSSPMSLDNVLIFNTLTSIHR
jgi:hypothetical protein